MTATVSAKISAPEQRRRSQVGGLLQGRRLERGLSLSEVARSAHVDPSQLHRIEHGQGGASRVTLCALAMALDFQPGDIDRLLFLAEYAPLLDWQSAYHRLLTDLPQVIAETGYKALAATEAARYPRASG